ncbi:MAG: 50S ribosomal protein L29 [Syntrophales bacterium]|nr:50S ribosomal protein L29 [Syntrophales bacterium]
MKADELRELANDELQRKERELREELFRLRLRKHTGQLTSPALIGKIRRDIARIKTVLRERGIK